MAEMKYGGEVACDAHDGYHLRETDIFATPSPGDSWGSIPTG
jgi:hypothetical protein